MRGQKEGQALRSKRTAQTRKKNAGVRAKNAAASALRSEASSAFGRECAAASA